MSRKLRERLLVVCPTPSDFDAFCHDYFPEAHRRFGSGMDRVAKETLLLSLVTDSEQLSQALFAQEQHNEARAHAARLPRIASEETSFRSQANIFHSPISRQLAVPYSGIEHDDGLVSRGSGRLLVIFCSIVSAIAALVAICIFLFRYDQRNNTRDLLQTIPTKATVLDLTGKYLGETPVKVGPQWPAKVCIYHRSYAPRLVDLDNEDLGTSIVLVDESLHSKPVETEKCRRVPIPIP